MKKLFIAAVTVLTLASCGTVQPDLYTWYDSEDATYQYTKRASDEKLVAAMEQYKKVINMQKGARQVAPPGRPEAGGSDPAEARDSPLS